MDNRLCNPGSLSDRANDLARMLTDDSDSDTSVRADGLGHARRCAFTPPETCCIL
jgi:hypothetical protein